MAIMPFENQGDETMLPALDRHRPLKLDVSADCRMAKEVPRLSRKRFACLKVKEIWGLVEPSLALEDFC